MTSPPVPSEPLTSRVPEPVARQVVALCNSLSKLSEQMDRLDKALGSLEEVQRERAATHA